jgi:hypothetical protein
MLHETQGRVIQIDNEITGEGRAGTWVKQEFTIETQEQFAKKIHFSAWGEKTYFLRDIQSGDQLKITFTIESREYNQRWYTDLRLFKLEKIGTDTVANSVVEQPVMIPDFPPPPEDDLPF